MKNLNLFRKSARGSEGSTLASAVVRPSFDRRSTVVKHLAFMLLFMFGSLNVWGELPESPTWEAKALADIADGSTIIIISNSTQATNIALPAAGAGTSNPPKKACTVSTTDGVSTITPPTGTTLQDLAWTVSKQTSTWKFYVEGSTTKRLYLTGLSSNTAVRVGDASSNYDNFVMGTGSKLLEAMNGTNRGGRFVGPNDNNGTDWRSYNSETGTNYKSAQLTFYVLKEESGDDVTVKTLKSIALSGQTTSFYQNTAFAFDGTCTATYSVTKNDVAQADEQKVVTPTSVSSPDMTTLGDKEVTVTFTDGEVSKEAKYTITVTEAPAAATYEKVTSTGDITDGEYLIVYETGNVAFNGALTTLDAVGNTVAVTINEGIITGSVAIDAAVFTIDMENMTIQSKSGYYIGITSYGNGLASNQNTSYAHQNITIDDNGNALLFFQQASWNSSKNGKMQLCYNEASNQTRFRYYKEGGQKAIQLYKKVEGAIKPAAGLAYAEADKNNLVKVGASFTAPTLTNPNSLTVAYTSSDDNVVAVDANSGALTIKAAGKAEITASFAGNDAYKTGSAKYTIFVAEQAGTAEDPLTEASAKALIDLGCTLNAHVTGVADSQNATNYTITLSGGFEFYKAKDLNNVNFTSAYVSAGDKVTAFGQLTKFNSTYELANGCYLTSYTASTISKTPIANDQATAYTVAQALVYAADAVTYDLDDEVYVRGKVAVASTGLFSEKYLTYSISDDGTNENVLKVYNGLGVNGADFTSIDDIKVGEIVIVKGKLYDFKGTKELTDNELVWKKPVATIAIDNMALEFEEERTISATITPDAAATTVSYDIKEGSDDCITLAAGKVTAKSVAGTATIIATIDATDDYEGATKEFTVTVAAPDTRKVAEKTTFASGETNGNLSPNVIAYESFKGNAGTAPAIYNNGIRLYQISGSNDFGGYITLTAAHGCKIDQVVITTTSTYSTKVAYSVDGNETLSESENVSASGTYSTPTGLDKESINILNTGTGGSGRLEIASIKVYYTGEAATIDHYELGGTYTTEFETGDEFNHDGLIVYAAYDAEGEDKVDITASCTFSEPDMSVAGEKTIEITYNEAVVKSYQINVTEATPDTRKIANSPATFTTVSGGMTPADIKYEAFKGNSSTDPAIYNNGIRLYQEGGYITISAVKGCKIDEVQVTSTGTYDCSSVVYTVNDGETELGGAAVAKESTYKTAKGLNAEKVNVICKGTSKTDRLEIASIKVWYTGEAATIDHYELGGTYATEFEKNAEFNHDGLIVYAAYDAQGDDKEDITAECTFSTPDMSEAGEKTIEITYKEIVVKSYTITVNASGKENPALAYNPASAIITAGDAWSAPILSNTFSVSPITYSSDKESVATVDAEGNIALAGGCGTAVITASFAGDDDYIESEATYTITVNKPAATPTSTVYRKVTATADITDGEYLIVYETTSIAFDGSLETLDAEGNSIAVTINEGEIAGSTEIDAATFTIDVTAGTLRSASGEYIGVSSNSNGLKQTEEAATYTHNFSIDEDGNAVIAAAFEGSTMTLRYNASTSAGNLRFRYYKNNGQQAIQLYKKVVVEPVLDWVEVRSGLEINRHYTVCLPKNITHIKGATFWNLQYKNAGNTEVYLVEETAPEAGKPYIIQATDTKLEVVYGEEIAADPVANGALRGTFTGINETDFAALEGTVYLLISNAIRPRTAGNYLDANRAYVRYDKLTVGTPASIPGRRVKSMPMAPAVATGVDQVPSDQVPNTKVLINGQLYIMYNGTMYNVQGQLVK